MNPDKIFSIYGCIEGPANEMHFIEIFANITS
jgi:hypothetical protein